MHTRARLTLVLLVLALALLWPQPAAAAGRRPPREDGGKEFRHMPIGTTQRRGSQTEPDRDRTYTRDTGRSRGGNQNGGGGPTGGPDNGVPPGAALFTVNQAIYAEYQTAVAQTVANNSATLVDYAAKVADSHNAVTTGAAWKFTAPASRVYTGTCSLMLSQTTGWVVGDLLQVSLYKNGAVYRSLSRNTAIASGGANIYSPQIALPFTIYLLTGEYLQVFVTQVSGGDLALHNDAKFNYFTIWSI